MGNRLGVAGAVLDSDAASVLDDQTANHGVGHQGEIRTVQRGPQVGVGSALSLTVNDVRVDGPETHLQAAADIAGAAVPALDRGGQTRAMQFLQWVSRSHYQR